MWSFQTKRNALREQLLLQAPESNPSEFVRRYLQQRSSLKEHDHQKPTLQKSSEPTMRSMKRARLVERVRIDKLLRQNTLA